MTLSLALAGPLLRPPNDADARRLHVAIARGSSRGGGRSDRDMLPPVSRGTVAIVILWALVSTVPIHLRTLTALGRRARCCTGATRPDSVQEGVAYGRRADSARAALTTGMSESAFFQSVKRSP